MDFPVFHLDVMGNRMLIALVAVMHVVINHAMAVGAMPLITLLEWRGHRQKDARWDQLAYQLLRVCFITTTTVGALTGVGIWFSVSLVNPYAIGSLIRVFFWAWFTEWLVFVTEVCLILAYYLLWKPWNEKRKAAHIRTGVALSIFSWITMALIVAILGFMMDPGAWQVGRGLFTAVFNPIYLPQLAFRTTLAMVEAGLFCWLLTPFFVREPEFRSTAIRFLARWILVWSGPLLLAALWYRSVVPDAMVANFAVALGTQAGAGWYGTLLGITLLAVVVIFGTAVIGAWRPKLQHPAALTVPFVLSIALLGQFERVREFVRKPYVISGQMFANGLREQDIALYQKEGMLRHATYCAHREIFPQNRLRAGRDVFRIACSRCHTTAGMNSLIAKIENLYGRDKWDWDRIGDFIENMHGARAYMPPFPGTKVEIEALVAYIDSLRVAKDRSPSFGDQAVGVVLPDSVDDQKRFTLWKSSLDSATSSIRDRQLSLVSLAVNPLPEARDEITAWLSRLEQNDVPDELQLDVVTAAQKRPEPELQQLASDLLAKLDANETLDRFHFSFAGGNAVRGASLFQTKTCIACHKVNGMGAEVGPDLSKVGSRSTREHLVESITFPAAKIAKGFESITVIRLDGTVVQGILKSEDASELKLKTAAGQEITVPIEEVDERVGGQSLMPKDLWKTLDRAELRDLTEFLASLK